MKVLKFLDDNLEKYICITLMSIMTIVIFVQVFMRKFMNNSLTWAEEFARYIFIWLIYIGISYGAKTLSHIRIEASLNLYPKKFRKYIIVLSEIIFLAFAFIIMYTSIDLIQKQVALDQKSPAMGISIWIVYLAPMVGFFLTAIRQVRVIKVLIKKHFKSEVIE